MDQSFRRARVIQCEPRANHRLWICFDDGISGEVDLSHLVGQGVFKSLANWKEFSAVYIDPRTETVTWSGGLDLDPYVLREKLLEAS